MIESIKEAIKERENNYPGDEYYYDNVECALDDADFWYQACRHLMGLEEDTSNQKENEDWTLECPELNMSVTFTKDYKIECKKL